MSPQTIEAPAPLDLLQNAGRLLKNHEVAALFGYKLPDQASAWSQFAENAGIPLIRLAGRRFMAEPSAIRAFLERKSTNGKGGVAA